MLYSDLEKKNQKMQVVMNTENDNLLIQLKSLHITVPLSNTFLDKWF